ncbi:hypothetical protein LJR118_002827 [Acidovorax sp. LjRoot118]|uniref:hypothetical protein n=1 Tax=Acidovorax sp. LjRoot118 TaxID=3342256 RepID=UPI003ECF2A27
MEQQHGAPASLARCKPASHMANWSDVDADLARQKIFRWRAYGAGGRMAEPFAGTQRCDDETEQQHQCPQGKYPNAAPNHHRYEQVLWTGLK